MEEPANSGESNNVKLRLQERAAIEAERDARFNRRFKLLELKERREDRTVRKLELTTNSGRGIRFTSAQATVAAGALAALSALAGGFIQAGMTRDVESSRNESQLNIEQLRAKATIDLEKQKQTAAERIAQGEFETTLILRAIEAPDRETQIRNLKFFLNAGFITDAEGKIANMDEADFPSLPPPDQRKQFSTAELASQFRRSIGVITVRGRAEDGSEFENVGTLFVVSDTGFAATASHLFNEHANPDLEIAVRLSDGSEPEIKAELISREPSLDLAILKLPSAAGRYLPVNLSPAAPSPGDRLVMLGFQHGLGFLVQSTTVVSFDGPQGTWVVDSQGAPGQAGAPVFSDSGEVIAFLKGSLVNRSGSIVRPIRTTMSLLSNFALRAQ